MNLIDYIMHAKDYIYFSMIQNPMEDIISSDKPEHFMIIPNSMTIHRNSFVEIF